MVTENVVLMAQARESLKGKWGIAIATVLVYILILSTIQFIPFVGQFAALLIEGPLELGMTLFALSIARRQEGKLEQLFQGFNNFGTSVAAYLLMFLYIILWMLLLIVPGIIAAFSYSMTYFIISDDPKIKATEAIKKSKQMMNGYKAKLFFLHLRFIGWFLLSILTLGIGFLWLIPYVNVSIAKFYEDIKNNPAVAEIQ